MNSSRNIQLFEGSVPKSDAYFVDASGTAVPGVPYGMMALPNEGGKTVVFVKGIPSEADNNLMSSILSRCGKVRPSHLSPSVTACSAFR